MPVHKVPVAKRDKEKAALDRYVKLGVMAKVDEPTRWCSNALIRETPKKVRVCIDPSQTINKAILRPVFQIPTLNEHLHKLCNAKCFFLVDILIPNHDAYLLWEIQVAAPAFWRLKRSRRVSEKGSLMPSRASRVSSALLMTYWCMARVTPRRTPSRFLIDVWLH